MANNEPMHVYAIPDGGTSTPLPPPAPAGLMDTSVDTDTDEGAASPADYNQPFT